MIRRKCWGQPVVYSCAEAAGPASFACPIVPGRTRFALDDRLNNDFVEGAGLFSIETGDFDPEGLALRPFPFRVVTHSAYGAGPCGAQEPHPYWNSCQGKDGCGDGGERAVRMTEAQMIRWLLEDA